MEKAEYEKMDALEKEHFWFIAKRKYLQIILDRFAPGGNSKVLDVGCGTGAIMDLLKSRGYFAEGVDTSEEALKFCREKGHTVQLGSADKMDYADESFDLVLASDVLEHLENDAAAVREVSRVLKKGGLFIATVPAHKYLWSYHDVALHHKRRYTKKEFSNLLKQTFDVEQLSWIHSVIFLPTLLVRGIKTVFGKNAGESDVKKINPVLNVIGKICYLPEVFCFRFFGQLPFGVSLIGVARKR